MIKDEFAPEEKNVEGLNEYGFIPIKDRAPTPTTRSWFGKDIVSDYVRIDKGNFLLHSPTEDVDRFFAGRDKNGEFVVKLSKPGIDVEDATNSQVLFSTNVIFFENTFISPSQNQSAEDTTSDTIEYVKDSPLSGNAKNSTPMVRFFKETDQTITSANLYLIFTDSYGVLAGGVQRVQDVHARLNPTKTAVNNPGVFTIWTYLTGGVDVSGAINPSSDGYTYSKSFSTTDLAGIQDGWNTLLLQSDTNTDPNPIWSYASITLVIRGYVNL